jgi:hypothetical protein
MRDALTIPMGPGDGSKSRMLLLYILSCGLGGIDVVWLGGIQRFCIAGVLGGHSFGLYCAGTIHHSCWLRWVLTGSIVVSILFGLAYLFMLWVYKPRMMNDIFLGYRSGLCAVSFTYYRGWW